MRHVQTLTYAAYVWLPHREVAHTAQELAELQQGVAARAAQVDATLAEYEEAMAAQRATLASQQQAIQVCHHHYQWSCNVA